MNVADILIMKNTIERQLADAQKRADHFVAELAAIDILITRVHDIDAAREAAREKP